MYFSRNRSTNIFYCLVFLKRLSNASCYLNSRSNDLARICSCKWNLLYRDQTIPLDKKTQVPCSCSCLCTIHFILCSVFSADGYKQYGWRSNYLLLNIFHRPLLFHINHVTHFLWSTVSPPFRFMQYTSLNQTSQYAAYTWHCKEQLLPARDKLASHCAITTESGWGFDGITLK
jgi:hypothetical protein